MLHYISVKSRRATSSVIYAELFAAIIAFEYASTMRVAVNKILGKDVPLESYTDSNSVYNSIFGINSTAEKKLIKSFAFFEGHMKFVSYLKSFGFLRRRILPTL